MTCVNCGSDNAADRRFCRRCGEPLVQRCTACGAANEQSDRFCGQCGGRLGGAAAPVPASPVSERRMVSVLFADLVGFTAFAEHRDADEVRDLLSAYFETAQRVVARYGGIIEKFIGDAVMAVWGTPLAQEDDAERAVRAALELVGAVPEIHEVLQARAGVLTGEASVTIGAEGQGMVAGDLVNTASRIQAAAPPGAVYVGDATRRATEAAIAYEAAGSHALKGKGEPVPLHRAERVLGGRGGAQRSVGLEAPFVGRDRELRLVKDLFHASADQARAQLLSVIGTAGTGKSRLVWEFFKYIDGLEQTMYWHRGRCLSYGEGVTYWALAEMVRGRAGIAEGEPASVVAVKLQAVAEEFVPDRDERTWVQPRLASLLGIEGKADAHQPEELFSAWRLFFERVAEQSPTVMVFEDLQWADRSLLDFIEYLVTWSRNHPLFVMTLARPDVLERHPNWGAEIRGATALHLEPLPDTEMQRLVDGLMPTAPDGFKRQVLERAEGVPLYAMETVRMLVDRGLLEQRESAYEVTGSVETLEVPETLHALIAARLDGLTADERRLIQDGAVLGKSFTVGALTSLSRRSQADLEPLLGSLVRKEILGVQADPRSPERGQYGFLQDLVRLVAYETLSTKERKVRHLAAAVQLEGAWSEEDVEVVEVIASHLLEAYRLAPKAPDAAEIKSKARDALIQAGHRSRSLAATEQARRYFERAIELAEEPPLLGRLHELAGAAAWTSGLTEPARHHFDLAISAYEGEGLARDAARVVARLGDLAWGHGRFEEALARMEEAYEVLIDQEPDESLALLAANIGRTLHFLGRNDESLARLEVALSLAERLQIPLILSEALNTKGLGLWAKGRREEGLLLIRHSLEVAQAHDLAFSSMRAINNISSMMETADRLAEALELSERGLELARRYGDALWESKYLAGMVNLFVITGRWDEAIARTEEVLSMEGVGTVAVSQELTLAVFALVSRGQLEEARTLFERIGVEDVEELQSRASGELALAALALGEDDPASALAHAEQAMELARPMGVDSGSFKIGFRLASDAALALGDLSKVQELLSAAESIPAGQTSPLQRAFTAMTRARLAVARSEGETVERSFKEAVAGLREVGVPFQLARAQLYWAEWLTGEGRVEEARPILAEALDTFSRLRAAPWIEQAERLAGPRAREPQAVQG